MKAILKTTGPFQLLCLASDQIVPDYRPAVVEVTQFFHSRIALGQLETVAGNLPDTATDAEWVLAIKDADGDLEKAVHDFLLTVEALAAAPADDQPKQPQRAKGKANGRA